MRLKWKVVALALPVALLVACKDQPSAPLQQTDGAQVPSFAATSGWSEFVYYVEPGYKFYAACIDDSVDESGHQQVRLHTVTTDNGSLITYQIHVLDDWHVLGDKTGIWKPALPNLLYAKYEERSSLVNGAYEFRINFNPYIYVNEVSGTKINNPLKLKMTINANGAVTVDRSQEGCNIIGS